MRVEECELAMHKLSLWISLINDQYLNNLVIGNRLLYCVIIEVMKQTVDRNKCGTNANGQYV